MNNELTPQEADEQRKNLPDFAKLKPNKTWARCNMHTPSLSDPTHCIGLLVRRVVLGALGREECREGSGDVRGGVGTSR